MESLPVLFGSLLLGRPATATILRLFFDRKVADYLEPILKIAALADTALRTGSKCSFTAL